MTALNFPSDTSSNYNAPNGLIYTYSSTKGVWLTTGQYSTGIIGAQKLDNISASGTSFNGVNVTFPLKVNNETIHPESELSLYIVLAGVPQEPLVSYTVDTQNGTITFPSAPEAGTAFYGTVVSRLPFSGIPDGGVTNAKVAANAAIAGSKLQAASPTVAGSMSAADFSKLAGIATSANNYVISSDLLDEDDMSSNSATKVPSQQSVKAYVDNNSGNLTVQDEGSALATTASTVNFTGAGVTASGTGTTKTVNIPGGGSGITVQEEGTALSTLATTINFVGTSVTASGTGATKTITITDSGEPNVQANWTESSDTSDAYIQNIPRKLSVDGSGNTKWEGNLFCDSTNISTAGELRIGNHNTGPAFTIKNDGTNTILDEESDGNLIIYGKEILFQKQNHSGSGSAPRLADFVAGDACKFYFNDSTTGTDTPKLQTASNGITVSGRVTADNFFYTNGTELTNSGGGGGGSGEANQNAFSNIVVSGQTTVAAASTTDNLTITAGDNITLTTDNTAKSVTINTEVTKTNVSTAFADNDQLQLGTVVDTSSESDPDNSNQLKLYYDGSGHHGIINVTRPNPTVAGNYGVIIQHNGAPRLEVDQDGTKWTGDLHCADEQTIKIGGDAAFQLWHTMGGGSNEHSEIRSNTGNLIVYTKTGLFIEDIDNSERYLAKFIKGGTSELYWDGSTNRGKKLETTQLGVTVTGKVTASEFAGDGSLLTSISYNDLDNKPTLNEYLNLNNRPQITLEGSDKTKWSGDLYCDSDTNTAANKLKIGNNGALTIYHDASDSDGGNHHSVIQESGGGGLLIYGSDIIFHKHGSTERMADFAKDGAVRLYDNGTIRLTTTASGVTIGGTLTATAFSGDGSSLTNLPDATVNKTAINDAFDDDDQLILGTGTGNDRLRLYYDGTRGIITSDNGVKLQYNGSNRLETLSAGAKWHGDLWCDDQDYIKLGDAADMTIRHDASGGSHFGVITVGNDSHLRLESFNNIELSCGDGAGGTEWSVFGSANSWTALYYQGNMRFYTWSNSNWSIGHFNPNSDDLYDLGYAQRRWDDIFATNNVINTSDRNEKNTIVDSDLGLSFVNRLKPVSYKFNGKTRKHYGLIAQDIETTLSDISKPTTDFAGFIKTDISEELYTKEDPDVFNGTKNIGDVKTAAQTKYGLRYGEFIAPLIKAVQELSTEVETLKTKVAQLEAG